MNICMMTEDKNYKQSLGKAWKHSAYKQRFWSKKMPMECLILKPKLLNDTLMSILKYQVILRYKVTIK